MSEVDMRLLAIVMSIILLVGFFGFVVTNLDARVDVTVWRTQYPSVSLHLVVLLSLVVGVLYAGIIGVAQGTQAWLINRRLGRDIQKLETELNYLRTQPVSRLRTDVEEDDSRTATSPTQDVQEDERTTFPSAPVYGDDDEDPDDDVYSGGHAV